MSERPSESESRLDPRNALRAQKLGQSLWYDNISRSLIDSGELDSLIGHEIVTGITTNPTIFHKAVVGSDAYEPAIDRLLAGGVQDVEAIYHQLTLADVRDAADRLRPVYDRTQGVDGYVSLEVLPRLAHDVDSTEQEALRLFRELDRPNVMIKVPGTEQGVVAFERLTAQGVNVNVTLLFSLAHYEAVARAYLAGLRRRLADGSPVGNVASVASFFVSRVDSAVDALLEKHADADARALAGKTGIANCKAVYQTFGELFGDGFADLRDAGARCQRVLWASTGTKNPAYPDTLYVDELLGAETVNTLPPATLEAFLDHGNADRATVLEDVSGARAALEGVRESGIDLAQVCAKLQDDGVAAFARSFDELLEALAAKVESRRARS